MKHLIATAVVLLLVIGFAVRQCAGDGPIDGARPTEPVKGGPADRSVVLQGDAGGGSVTKREVAKEERVPEDPDQKAGVDPVPMAALVVNAVDRVGGAPVQRVRVKIWPEGPTPEGTFSFQGSESVEGNQGTLNEWPLTDERGQAVIHLPADVPARIEAIGQDAPVGRMEATVAALAPGERREITIQLPVGFDVRFCGLVVAAANGEPIAGASVRLQSRGLGMGGQNRDLFFLAETHVEVFTDSDGRFEVGVQSSKPWQGRVDALGFGPALFCPAGHADPDHALRIELHQGSSLRGTVSGVQRLEDHSIHVQAWVVDVDRGEYCQDLFDPFWTLHLPRDGSWEVGDLPAGAWLQAVLVDPEGKGVRRATEIVLEPGEERVLDWEIGAGATIVGQAVLADTEEPLWDLQVWLVQEDRLRYGWSLFDSSWQPTTATRTDREGRFTFEDVSPGSWIIGPAPRGQRRKSRSAVPLSEVIEVPAQTGELEVVLRVHRARSIRGTVTDPSGRPMAGAYVSASDWNLMLSSWSSADGSFVVKPLPPGDFTLVASDDRDVPEYADSEALTAPAGTEGIVLQLRPGGRISGVIVDGTTPSAARVIAYSLGDVHGWAETDAEEDGRFELGCLVAGTYALTASAGDRIGVLGNLLVSPGNEIEGVVVSLEQCASLTIRHGVDDGLVECAVLVDGIAIESNLLGPGDEEEWQVPPGELSVRFVPSDDDDVERVETRTPLTLEPGEKAEVVWTGPEDRER